MKIRFVSQNLWKEIFLIIGHIDFKDFEAKTAQIYINHTARQVMERCFVKVWYSILEFYLTSYCDFLFQVKHSFLLLDQSGILHMSEPRYHLRESQDPSAYE